MPRSFGQVKTRPSRSYSSGEPFAAGETAGYLLVEASAAEAAELHRGRYALLQLIEKTS